MSSSPKVATLRTKEDRARATCLSAYLAEARADSSVLTADWVETYWAGVGYFVKQSFAPRGSLSTEIPSEAIFDSAFVDFAKAFVTERYLVNPAQSRTAFIKRLQALRCLEAALLELKSNASPLLIDLNVLTAAAARARETLKSHGPYRVGMALQELATVMVREGVLPPACGSWANPNKQPKNDNIAVDRASQEAREKKLPDDEALFALAAIFNRDLDPASDRDQRDIFTTSVAALLMCAPSRGSQILSLPKSLMFRATDKFDDEQLGLRVAESKGFGAYVKWVWADMVPVAEKAVERLIAMTEEARKLARHFENPKARGRFYRHAGCPSVPDDQPLTKAEIGQALGLLGAAPDSVLKEYGLDPADGAYTLQRIWNEFVLPKHEEMCPHFPYVSAIEKAKGRKGGLKYSEALFCMLRFQIHSAKSTSPVFLWMPNLTAFTMDTAPQVESVRGATIFERFGYVGSAGQQLRLTSHQVRHLINTEAQRTGLTDEQIAYWSGRQSLAQNTVYDHQRVEERVAQARADVEKVSSAIAMPPAKSELPTKDVVVGQWVIKVVRRSPSDGSVDIQPHLAGLKTLYGECHHDWALAPCEGFVACINCREHACIKGSDEDAQVKLGRLRDLHREVLREVERAKATLEEDIGAQDWLEVQQRYADKLEQLIAILKDERVPDGSVIRSANGLHPTHLHRALRGMARRAIESGTDSKVIMAELLQALDDGLASVDRVSAGERQLALAGA